MHHQNSVLYSILKHVPWAEFDRLVEEHGADVAVRRLTTKSQFIALLYAQLAGISSLRQLDGSNNVGQFRPLATPLLVRTVKAR